MQFLVPLFSGVQNQRVSRGKTQIFVIEKLGSAFLI